MIRKYLAILLCLVVACSCAYAEPLAGSMLSYADAGLDLPGGSVHYPQLKGLDDAAVDAVQQAIVETGGIGAYLDRLMLLGSSPIKLNVTYTLSERALTGQVLSVVFSADGPIEDTRATSRYTTVNLDLTDGHTLTFADLFTDENAARAFMENYLLDTVFPELSPHLSNSDLLPLPEVFSVDEAGLTLYYPIRQLSTLSDKAGAIQLSWCELAPYLRLGDGTLLQRIGAQAMVTPGSRSLIEGSVHAGSLPGIPLVLGGSVQEAVARWSLLIDPDLYDSGRLLSLDGAPFRGVYLMTDRLTDSFDHSVIQGLRMDRGNLWGLCIGTTTKEQWRALLGEATHTVTLSAQEAEAQRLPSGESDYYEMGGHRLRLHANENGVLVSLMLLD